MIDLRLKQFGPSVYTFSNLLHYLARTGFPARSRDQRLVMGEYNGARSELWKEDLTYDELVFGSQQKIYVLMDDVVQLGTAYQVRHRLVDLLIAAVGKLCEPTSTIVEFGSGTGRNIFALAKAFPACRFVGFELTPKSVQYSMDRAHEWKIRNAEFRVGDMTADLDLPKETDVIFSVHALEQLPGQSVRAAISQMISKANRGVVLHEPIRELYPHNVRGWASRLRMKRADYVNGILNEITNPYTAKRLGIGHNPFNETCEVLIQKNA